MDKLGLHKDHYTGATSEVQATAYYLEQGFQVYMPVVQQSWVDFIVEKDGILFKVQVKTATWNKSAGRYKYLQCRMAFTNKYKVRPKEAYDIMIIVKDEMLWEIPSYKIDTTNLSLMNTNPNSNKEYKWDEYKRTRS